jgi:hypothetical protein
MERGGAPARASVQAHHAPTRAWLVAGARPDQGRTHNGEILSRDVDPERPFGGYVGEPSIPAASEPAPPSREPLEIHDDSPPEDVLARRSLDDLHRLERHQLLEDQDWTRRGRGRVLRVR